MKVCRVATECSWNDGSKTQYYIVILDWLPGRSRGLEQAPEWRVRGPLTYPSNRNFTALDSNFPFLTCLGM